MNPFEFQAQMIEAWTSATRTAFTTAIDFWSQAAGLAKPDDSQRLVSLFYGDAKPAWPTWPAPSFPQMPFPASPMAALGGGWPFPSPFASPQMMGWPTSVTVWPMAFFMSAPIQIPFGQMPFGQVANPWWPMGMFGGQAARTTETLDPKYFFDQMATSYRTASGYAAAAVMGPFGTPVEPKQDGVPFWMFQSGNSRRDVN